MFNVLLLRSFLGALDPIKSYNDEGRYEHRNKRQKLNVEFDANSERNSSSQTTNDDDTTNFATRRKSNASVNSSTTTGGGGVTAAPSSGTETTLTTDATATVMAADCYPTLYGWSYPTSLDYVNYGSVASSVSKVPQNIDHCSEGTALPTSTVASTENTSESPLCSEYTYKSLLYNSRPSLKANYYNSTVYNGQYFPAYQSTGAFYPAANGQTYSHDPMHTYSRTLKASPYSSLSAYFGSTTGAPYYSAGVYSSCSGLGVAGANGGHFAGSDWYNAPSGFPCYAANAYASTPSATTLAAGGYHLPPLTSNPPLVDEAKARSGGGQSSPFSKAETKKGKTKKRKQAALSPSPENCFYRVFIWDLEETCIIYQSLLNGTFASKYNKDPTLSRALGERINEMVLDLSESYFFSNELEDYDQVHIDDATADELTTDLTDYGLTPDAFQLNPSGTTLCLAPSVRGGVDWVRKLALRYRRIREIYETYRTNVGGLLGSSKQNQWFELSTELDTLTDSWQNIVTKCLSLISSRFTTEGFRCVNILVTSTQLVQTLSKLLLYNVAHLFPIENVYSAAKIGKEACFERIITKFGKKCTYVIIGDGRDEELASKQLQLPFWKIGSHRDLSALNHALEKGHL